MSFSKSRVTRFNENAGCAPGVGSYNVTVEAKVSGAAMVEKSTRFREIKDSCGDDSLSRSSSMGELRTPNKANLSTHGIERRKKFSSVSTPCHQAENGKIRQLETKIKHLVLQETEMNRRLLQAQEKGDRLDGRLQVAIKEKGQLQGQLAKSEKQVLELSRSKEVLRNKVENLESSHVRHSSVSEELESAKLQLKKKEKELEAVQLDLENKVHSLTADLKAAQSTIKALQDTRQALEQTNQEMRDHGDAIEEEINQLQALADCLREENLRLQDNYSSVLLRQDASDATMETVKQSLMQTESRLDAASNEAMSLQQTNAELEKELEAAESSISTLQDQESQLKERLSKLETQLSDLQTQYEEETQRRKEAEEKVDNLGEELKSAEERATESLRHVTDKYQSLEAVLAQAEADLAWEGETHRVQLAAAQAVSQQRATETEALQIQNRDLIHAYNIEKEECDLLREQIADLTTVDEEMEMISDRIQQQEQQGIVLSGLRADLGETLQTLEAKKTQAMERTRLLEEERQKEKLQHEEEKTKVTAALLAEKDQVAFLQGQLAELGEEMENEMDEVTGLDHRLKLQEDMLQSISSDKEQLQTRLQEMESEKSQLVSSLRELEAARDQDQQKFAEEKEKLRKELNSEMERVSELETQLKELGEDFEELSNIETRLAKQEGTMEDITLDKERLHAMLKLAEDKQASAEQALEQTRTDKKTVEGSLAEQQDLAASLQSSLSAAERTKESLMTQVDLLQAAKKKLCEDLLAGQQNIHRLECEAASAQQESSQLRVRLGETESSLKAQVADLEGACHAQRAEFGRRLVETQTKLSGREADLEKERAEHEAKTAQMRARLEERIEDLEERLQVLQTEADNHKCIDMEAIDILRQESESWEAKFKELLEKVAPFQEQLDQFEMERRMLLSQNDAAQSEVNKLSSDYARLLGHQNQKQKIHHIMKIKDENFTLKKEVTKLREENTKHTKTLRQMKDKVEKAEGKKKFDPSMAFKNGKENQARPLAQRN